MIKPSQYFSTLLASGVFCLFVTIHAQAESSTTMSPQASPNSIQVKERDVFNQGFHDLTTHARLKKKLLTYQRLARNPIQVGPLIKNSDNNGLIDIDRNLLNRPSIKQDVCGGDNLQPTVREAVICTINDGGRGNQNPMNVGFSTQGRELWAARLGNERGRKVLIITQQHGNEVRSTEAALRIIKHLALSKSTTTKEILDTLHILFIVRANPDGGEPSSNCFIGTPFGSVIEEDCALTRTNVDPQAGGGYSEDSEEDFLGTVGVGYNLNRYHFVDLKHPIRPQETQAMVAVGLAWGPDVVLDLHGDINKTSCLIDSDSIVREAILGRFPKAQCQTDSDQSPVVFSPFVTTLNEDNGTQQHRSRSLAARVAKKVQQSGFGTVNRFAQIRTGTGVINEGTIDAYAKLGAIVGGWESLNFTFAVSLSIQRVTSGMPIPGLNTEWFRSNGRFRVMNTRMNQVAIMEALTVIKEWSSVEPMNDGGYCDLPLTTGVKVAFPETIFDPGPGYGPFLIPLIDDFFQGIDSCPR